MADACGAAATDAQCDVKEKEAAVHQQCRSCSRLSSPDFFQRSTTSADIAAQLSDFAVLLEDQSLFNDIPMLLVDIASRSALLEAILVAISHHTLQVIGQAQWTLRNIAVSAAILLLHLCRIHRSVWGRLSGADAVVAIIRDTTTTLRTRDGQAILDGILKGILEADAAVLGRYGSEEAQHAPEMICSVTWIAEMFTKLEEMATAHSISPTIGALWAASGAYAAILSRPLTKIKLPPKLANSLQAAGPSGTRPPEKVQTIAATSKKKSAASGSGKGSRKMTAAEELKQGHIEISTKHDIERKQTLSTFFVFN